MRKEWTSEQVAKLKELFPTTSLVELSIAVEHPYGSTIAKCLSLKLKKSAEYRKAYLAINRIQATKAQSGKPAWNRKEKATVCCKWCKQNFEVIPARANSAIFCKRACMTAWRKTIVGEAHWLDTKIDCTCQWCGAAFRAKKAKVGYGEGIYCSRRCIGSSVAFMLSQQKGPTSIELKVENYLAENGIDFISQYKIGPWCVDVFIPALNLIVECDGDYWHSIPKVKVRDKNKNSYLRKEGYGLLRITETQINESVEAALAPVFQT